MTGVATPVVPAPVVPALEVHDLHTVIGRGEDALRAVNGVSFSIAPGEIHGLVGESGSGKSITAFSVMGLLEPPLRVTGGEVRMGGRDILSLDAAARRSLRGRDIAMIFQDPMMTLNPLMRIRTQMIDAIQAHERVTTRAALGRSIEMLGRVGIPSPGARIDAYPHEFSGGMRQRVAIAIALLNGPKVVLADEPTTALDVTIQSQILFQARALASETGTAFLWISHDLSVVSGLVDRISVMYLGRIVESGPADEVLMTPRHPYTRGLLDSLPAMNERGAPLRQISGMAPSLDAVPPGCAFAPRCNRATPACTAAVPPLSMREPNRAVRCVHPLDGGAA